MDSLSWFAALTLLASAPNGSAASSPAQEPAGQASPSPAQQSVPPDKRAEDRPAHESPYSAFGAPHARRGSRMRKSGRRLHCADGTTQTQGQKGAKDACEDHGGAKAK